MLQLAVDLDIPTNLSQVGIKQSDIELLATEAMKVLTYMIYNQQRLQIVQANLSHQMLSNSRVTRCMLH